MLKGKTAAARAHRNSALCHIGDRSGTLWYRYLKNCMRVTGYSLSHEPSSSDCHGWRMTQNKKICRQLIKAKLVRSQSQTSVKDLSEVQLV